MILPSTLDKYKSNKKKARFRLFLFSVIEWLCIIFYYTISGISRTFDWTVERLTTTTEGFIIQIIYLVGLIDGIIIALYVIIYIILVAKGSD